MSNVNSNAPFRKMLKFKAPFADLSRLIFPATCIACESELSANEEQICFMCENNLPYTYFEKYKEASALDQKFWGRVQLEASFSLCYFESDKAIQSIIHQLKYMHNKAIGIRFGKMMGQRIQQMEKFNDLDALLPVPLHHRKEFVRGYNQSDILCKGIQNEIAVPTLNTFLQKEKHTKSQTKNNRFFRWEQAKEQFSIRKNLEIPYKHIAIVDDVITTGSTLEGLILKIKEQYPELKISIVSLAVVR